MAQQTIQTTVQRAVPPNNLETSAERGENYQDAITKLQQMNTELFACGNGIFPQVAEAAKTTSTTLTAAELIIGLITGLGGAAVNYQLPLGSALETALAAIKVAPLAVNDAFEFCVINIDTTGANTITLTTNTGWTLVGDMVLAGNAAGDESSGTFRVRRTAANTFTIYRI